MTKAKPDYPEINSIEALHRALPGVYIAGKNLTVYRVHRCWMFSRALFNAIQKVDSTIHRVIGEFEVPKGAIIVKPKDKVDSWYGKEYFNKYRTDKLTFKRAVCFGRDSGKGMVELKLGNFKFDSLTTDPAQTKRKFTYKKGVMRTNKVDKDKYIGCSYGLHFYAKRRHAVKATIS